MLNVLGAAVTRGAEQAQWGGREVVMVQEKEPAECQKPEQPPIVAWCRICGTGMEQRADYCAKCHERYTVVEGATTWSREQVSEALDGINTTPLHGQSEKAQKEAREAAAATVTTSQYEPRVTSAPQWLSSKWIGLMQKRGWGRDYFLSRITEVDADASATLGSAFAWMDQNGYPSHEQAYLPDGLLTYLATRYDCSERTVQRRLDRADEILAGLSVTFS